MESEKRKIVCQEAELNAGITPLWTTARKKWFAVVVDDIPFEVHAPHVYKVVEQLVSRLGLTFTDTAQGVKTSTGTVMKHLLNELPSI